MNASAQAFGAALRLLRTGRNLKQWQVAEKAGMTKAMLSSYETGKVTPTLQSLATVFKALGTDFVAFQDALNAVLQLAPGKRPEDWEPQDYHHPPPEFLELTFQTALMSRLRSVETQLDRIATCLETLARRQPTG